MRNIFFEETSKNIEALISIRDNENSQPSVRVQSIQALNKLVELSDLGEDEKKKIIEKNSKTLRSIRDCESVEPAVRIQAINAIHKVIKDQAPVEGEKEVTTDDIMKKIRSSKK